MFTYGGPFDGISFSVDSHTVDTEGTVLNTAAAFSIESTPVQTWRARDSVAPLLE
ncbi:uncharacterized protein METZ01_LOCUS33300 [marine metagenome]|uniref:Uncharacterized protein n=1 Tax=marine metagenome TaxID=408172 RepID=A0A381QM52_9ZZZZ